MTQALGISRNALSIRDYGASRGSHSHAHFQVLLGLAGELELEVAGRGQRVRAGGSCVIAPGERHDFESLGGSQCLVLDTTDDAWAECHRLTPPGDCAQALAGYLQLALVHRHALAIHHAPRLLLDCWRSAPTGKVQVLARSRRTIDWTALAAWAEQHLHESLAVADLARQVCLSPTQFAARCRDETGQSVMQWLRSLRLARAQQLRLQGLPMAYIASRCGYRSASALGTALRVHGPFHGAGT